MTTLAPAPTIAAPALHRHVPALDGVRGYAVLLVLISHADVLPGGAIGVDLFFVLSGYLITGLMVKEIERTGRLGFRNFYMRRALRLLPALFLACIAYVLFMAITHQGIRWPVQESLIAVFYSTNWFRALGHDSRFLNHTWSLSVEEQFYMVWPLVTVGLIRLGRRRAALVCAVASVGVMVYRAALEGAGVPFHRIYNGSDTRADALLAGAALALVVPIRGKLAGLVGWLGVLGMAFIIITISMWGVESYPFTAVTLASLAILVGVLSGGWLNRLCSARWAVWVGKISYGLYLFHFPIMSQMLGHGYSRAVVAVVGIAATFAVAVASYYLVEVRFLRLKRYWG